MELSCPMCGKPTPGDYGQELTCRNCLAEFGPLPRPQLESVQPAPIPVAPAEPVVGPPNPRRRAAWIFSALSLALPALATCSMYVIAGPLKIKDAPHLVLLAGELVVFAGLGSGITSAVMGGRWGASDGWRWLGVLGAVVSLGATIPVLFFWMVTKAVDSFTP